MGKKETRVISSLSLWSLGAHAEKESTLRQKTELHSRDQGSLQHEIRTSNCSDSAQRWRFWEIRGARNLWRSATQKLAMWKPGVRRQFTAILCKRWRFWAKFWRFSEKYALTKICTRPKRTDYESTRQIYMQCTGGYVCAQRAKTAYNQQFGSVQLHMWRSAAKYVIRRKISIVSGDPKLKVGYKICLYSITYMKLIWKRTYIQDYWA